MVWWNWSPRAVGLMIEVISVLILRAYMPTSNVGLSLTWSQDQSVSSAVCGRPVVDVWTEGWSFRFSKRRVLWYLLGLHIHLRKWRWQFSFFRLCVWLDNFMCILMPDHFKFVGWNDLALLAREHGIVASRWRDTYSRNHGWCTWNIWRDYIPELGWVNHKLTFLTSNTFNWILKSWHLISAHKSNQQ